MLSIDWEGTGPSFFTHKYFAVFFLSFGDQRVEITCSDVVDNVAISSSNAGGSGQLCVGLRSGEFQLIDIETSLSTSLFAPEGLKVGHTGEESEKDIIYGREMSKYGEE